MSDTTNGIPTEWETDQIELGWRVAYRLHFPSPVINNTDWAEALNAAARKNGILS